MLTRLRFKNWRSLRDVTIDDLTPITVFIGANSSGKTNIVDGLHFLRYSSIEGNRGVVGAVVRWGGREKILTAGVNKDQPIELEYSFAPRETLPRITQTRTIEFVSGDKFPIRFTRKTTFGDEYIERPVPRELPMSNNSVSSEVFSLGSEYDLGQAIAHFTHTYVRRRWQLLKENFTPLLNISLDNEPGDLYFLDPEARNFSYILNFVRLTRPAIFSQLQDDLSWLLSHVSGVTTELTAQEIRTVVKEDILGGQVAPSVSGGTLRILAILVANYLLDVDEEVVRPPSGTHFVDWSVPVSSMPGLVVIEEPDTAVNPGLLVKLVDLLRTYTETKPGRQFILTTHNPAFLNYFQPEEVRIVERDAQGYTHVNRVPQHVSDIWLKDDYGLGEVWVRNVLGGLGGR